jgi:non-heme Fe2+,alpha-ketoglutarate-dependent halogenase
MHPEAEQTYFLSPSELQQFHKQGFAGPFRLYDTAEMKEKWKRERLKLMDRRMAVYQDEGLQQGNTNISNYDRHLDSTFLADHICQRGIADRVASILGPNVLCWRTEFFPKYPGDEGTDWHQADTFANASGTPQILWPDDLKSFGGTITVWTAFTDARIDTGCLQFIPGTHVEMHYDETKRMHYNPDKINRTQKGGVARGFFGYDYRELQKDPDWRPDESAAISMELSAGEAVMFWSTLMHASHPHKGQTGEMRLGFAARYVPACVRIYPDTEVIDEYGGRVRLDKYGAVLVCGKDEYGHNRIATSTTSGYVFPRH